MSVTIMFTDKLDHEAPFVVGSQQDDEIVLIAADLPHADALRRASDVGRPDLYDRIHMAYSTVECR